MRPAPLWGTGTTYGSVWYRTEGRAPVAHALPSSTASANGIRVVKSDSQLKRDMVAELNGEPWVNPEKLGVEVTEGIVTLAGHVDSFNEKWHAERAAWRVPGVKGLAVAIDVSLPGPSRRTDEEIARSAENVLKWTTFLLQDSVTVKVENGWITLSGEVEGEFRRRNALKAVRYLTGVTGVSDMITVKPRAPRSAGTIVSWRSPTAADSGLSAGATSTRHSVAASETEGRPRRPQAR